MGLDLPLTVDFLPLLPHPAFHDDLAADLEAAARAWRAADGGLCLDYRLGGPAAAWRIPPMATPRATDGLWQHTCCEAFVAGESGTAYREFNFSPATTWAVYAFRAYRERDSHDLPPAPPSVAFQRTATAWQLTAHLPAVLLPASTSLAVGLAVVVETADGNLDYRALHHAGPRPDFHLRNSFTLCLP